MLLIEQRHSQLTVASQTVMGTFITFQGTGEADFGIQSCSTDLLGPSDPSSILYQDGNFTKSHSSQSPNPQPLTTTITSHAHTLPCPLITPPILGCLTRRPMLWSIDQASHLERFPTVARASRSWVFIIGWEPGCHPRSRLIHLGPFLFFFL